MFIIFIVCAALLVVSAVYMYITDYSSFLMDYFTNNKGRQNTEPITGYSFSAGMQKLGNVPNVRPIEPDFTEEVAEHFKNRRG